jgi:hypothetical protein
MVPGRETHTEYAFPKRHRKQTVVVAVFRRNDNQTHLSLHTSFIAIVMHIDAFKGSLPLQTVDKSSRTGDIYSFSLFLAD